MKVAFDPSKDTANIAKHGVSLAFGIRVFDDPEHIVLHAARPIDAEERAKVIGLVDGKCWTAIHVVRGQMTRFISVRRSNDGEERLYRVGG